MKLSRRSTLSEVAASVSTALAEGGIRAVLTGGACATIYTDGAYKSEDLDFVLQSSATREQLDDAMKGIGFERRGDQYVHPATSFFVEFPPGPLAIGEDFRIKPVEFSLRRKTVLALSATDSCRDRLAAFYFWQDRQSLKTATQIAVRNSVDMGHIESWSIEEGHRAEFEEFAHEVTRERKRRRRRKATTRVRRRPQ